jgi:activator of HSP90 ATPase
MNTIPGSEFSLWNDSITGKNIEFVEDKKIVQQWYFGEQPEPSIVNIILHKDKNGTSFELRHTNIPEEDYEDITEGWTNNYIGSLLDFFD